MSDLLSLLGFGSNAMSAQNASIATATNNVANANTEGYSREQVQLSSLQASPIIGGVLAANPSRYASSLLGSQIVGSASNLSSSTTTLAALTGLQSSLTTSGATIDQQLAAMFASLSQVAATPTDKDVRDGAVASIQGVVTTIHAAATAIASARTDADQSIRDSATQATTLAAQIAADNKSLAGNSDPTTLDHRDLAAKQLAQLVGGQALIDPNGQMRYVLDGGAVLVDGTHAASLTATPDPTTGLAKLTVVAGASQRDVTTQLTGGSIGAALTFRDTTAVAVGTQLDQVAYDMATAFNGTSTANAGLDGVSGRPMFTPLATVAGAAAGLAIDPGLAANSDELATAAVGAGPGDNTGALALFGLGSQQIATGGTRTIGDASLDVIGGVAQQTATATAAQTTDQTVDDNLAGLRDSLAGVDTQEETTNLAKFENVSSALTKFVSTINDMLTSLISAL